MPQGMQYNLRMSLLNVGQNEINTYIEFLTKVAHAASAARDLTSVKLGPPLGVRAVEFSKLFDKKSALSYFPARSSQAPQIYH